MNFLHEKIRKWIPSKSDDIESRDSLIQLYSLVLGADFSPIFKQYGRRIQKLEHDFIESAITSGAMCFFGSLIMSIVQLGYINNIDELFTFAACYILTDHYLDDNTIKMEEKVKTIEQINDFIDEVGSKPSKNNVKIDSPLINVISKYYINMLNKIPSSETHLRKIFYAEVKTMYLQRNDFLDRNTYLEISEWKGGLFCSAIQSLLELEITPAEYDLGAAIQLVDDIMDIEDDIELKINSIATYDFKTYGNLDKLLIYTVNKIDKLDRKYTFFKPILYMGLTLAVHNNRNKYSSEMLSMVENFIYYQPTTTKSNLISWLKSLII